MSLYSFALLIVSFSFFLLSLCLDCNIFFSQSYNIDAFSKSEIVIIYPELCFLAHDYIIEAYDKFI